MWKLRRSFPWCSMNRLEPLPEHARRVLAKRIWPADIRIAAMADLSQKACLHKLGWFSRATVWRSWRGRLRLRAQEKRPVSVDI